MNQIQILTALRGIAILGVLFHHYAYRYLDLIQFHFKILNTTLYPLAFLDGGWTAVNLFFILSGMVLFYPYVNAIRSLKSSADVLDFYKNRAWRIFPLYWFSLLISLIFIHPLESNFHGFLDGLILFSGSQTWTKDLWFPPSHIVLWSISVEIWFSIVFPLFVVLMNKWGALPIYLISIPFCMAVRFYSNSHTIFDLGTPYLGILKDGLLGRLDDFLLGMWLIAAYYRVKNNPIQNLWSKWGLITGILLLLMSFQIWNMVTHNIFGRTPIPYLNLSMAWGWAFIIWYFLINPQGYLTRLFSAKIFIILGTMCYSIYLWHNLIRDVIVARSTDFIVIASAVVTTIIISTMTFYWIEKAPMPHFLKKKSSSVI